VQHGENATKSVALASVGADFLARAPVGRARQTDGAAASRGGLFVFDVEKAAAPTRDAFLAKLMAFLNTDDGHAPDRASKLGI
jgi:hypothetical protein